MHNSHYKVPTLHTSVLRGNSNYRPVDRLKCKKAFQRSIETNRFQSELSSIKQKTARPSTKHSKSSRTATAQPRTRKAFFFIVVSLLLLTYVLSNLTLWSKAIEIQEKRISEGFKSSTLEFMVSQIKQDDVEEFSKVAASYAVYSLNNHSIKNPVKEGDAANLYSNINLSVHDLLANGEAGAGYFAGEELALKYTDEELASYTFKGFFDKLDKTLQNSGLKLDSYSFTGFSMNQSDYTTLNFSFTLEVKASDNFNTASLSRTFQIVFELPIDGLVDPAVAREMQKEDYGSQIIEKQIFLGVDYYQTPGALWITEGVSSFGQGWFYGPVWEATNGNFPSRDPLQVSSWILKGTEAEIGAAEDRNLFGAYIITDIITVDDLVNDFDKPVFLSPNPKLSRCEDERCILFVSQYSPKEINNHPQLGGSSAAISYGIEDLKDFVMCGYYIPDPEGPSYFQRLLDDSFSPEKKNEEFGIASFLIWDGIEAKGKLSDLSRLDYEFFNGEDGKIIRGMPGCKYAAICSQEGAYVGQFKLSDTALKKYVKENWDATHIYCEGDEWSSCEGN